MGRLIDRPLSMQSTRSSPPSPDPPNTTQLPPSTNKNTNRPHSPQLGQRLLHGLEAGDFLSEGRTTKMRPAIFSLVNTVVGGGA
jgi:hypothetical protein